ncbi:nucleotidyltransferase family protein [Larkinella soli]|uniref:nucleotidyltransferase family protein n=1 Tax=Larkinella soli TaxID=1770527 RepID=UPI000FFB9387|nr:nucleotidyltransferase domain-containing protein [Larkinella soli]
MPIPSILAGKLSEISCILKENKVKRAYAFGSVCTDHFTDQSDIDLLIAFDEGLDPVTYGQNYFTVLYAMESLFERPVDLVTERSLKNPYFIKVMNQTKIPIYEG